MNIPLRRYWNLLIQYLRNQKRQFALLTVLLLSGIGLQVLIPQVTRYFIDTALDEGGTRALTFAAVLYLALAIGQQLFAIGTVYVGENVAWVATNQLRLDLTAHCLKLDMAFHNNTSPGTLIERIDGDVSQLANFFSQMVIRVFGNMLLLGGILVVLYIEDLRIGIAFTFFAFTTLYALNRIRSIAVPYEKARREAVADLFGFLEERLAGTEDIRSSGAVGFVISRLQQLHGVIYEKWIAARIRYTLVWAVAGTLTTLGYAIAIISGYAFFTSGSISVGTVFLLIQYTNLITRPLREITQEVENLQNVGGALERLEDLLAETSTLLDGSGAQVAQTGPLGLAFSDVTFAYHDDENVLDDVSFTLKPGEVMGLLGRTGSGKTTITRLVFRLYQPQDGAIALNDVDIRDMGLDDLRHRVALVTQDVQLFEATVRDNITFFDRTVDDGRIMDVIDQLELRPWFETLPKGLDTRLETGGRSLSAGEAQLLAFTRVFLRDPGLVILDEASSRLDPATEQLIERAVDRLLADRTGIIIAHRLGTVQRADHILILQDGKVIEHGERVALAADNKSRFYNLLQTGLEEVLV